MKEKFFSSLTKSALVVFLLSAPFSYAYSLANLGKNKSFTAFSLYNIYLIDVAAIFLLIAFLLNLYWHKKSFLAYWTDKRWHIPAFIFAVLAFASFIWSGSPYLSAFSGLRLILMISALYIVISLIKNSNYYQNIFFKILIAAGAVESFIALGQFIFGQSLGLYFLGESHLGLDILGLARINLFGHDFLRAYGTFPHPNILGGFLLLTLAATYYFRPVKYRNVLLGIQTLGLALTFSRTAIMGFLLILFLNRNTPIRLILPRISQKIQVKILGLILFSLLFLRSPIERIMNGRDETISIRLEYAKAALVRFADSPILGRGWGTGPVELPAFSNFFFYSWEMQPVHNIYLLVVSDLGIIGLSIFLYFIYRVLVGPKNIWKYLFIAYLVIGLLDHYLLTLPQGIFIFFASALLADVLEQKKERIPTKV